MNNESGESTQRDDVTVAGKGGSEMNSQSGSTNASDAAAGLFPWRFIDFYSVHNHY